MENFPLIIRFKYSFDFSVSLKFTVNSTFAYFSQIIYICFFRLFVSLLALCNNFVTVLPKEPQCVCGVEKLGLFVRQCFGSTRYLDYTLDPSKIRKQDTLSTIEYIAQNVVGMPLAWTFVRAKWSYIYQQ